MLSSMERGETGSWLGLFFNLSVRLSIPLSYHITFLLQAYNYNILYTNKAMIEIVPREGFTLIEEMTALNKKCEKKTRSLLSRKLY